MASAPGETSLATLLSTLTLTLQPQTFVFITYSASSPPPSKVKESAQMVFRENEGTTIITTLGLAEENNALDYTFPCKMITCNVHSSLEAVGFMAAITKRLTELGIGTNPVSGFFHDHLFVPVGREDEAVAALENLAREAKAE